MLVEPSISLFANRLETPNVLNLIVNHSLITNQKHVNNFARSLIISQEHVNNFFVERNMLVAK